MFIGDGTVRTSISSQGRKAKVLRGEISALLVWTSIQYIKDFASNVVGYIRDILEGIFEWANQKAIISV